MISEVSFRTIAISSFSIALLFTLLLWGLVLLPTYTLSPEGAAVGVGSNARVNPKNFDEVAHGYKSTGSIDAGGGWQEVPIDYYFHWMKTQGGVDRLPKWNPYIGSGYPIYLDGHNSYYSPVRWFLRQFPGEQSRDIWIFLRALFWIWGITLGAALLGAGRWVMNLVALGAGLVPHISAVVDHVFLDADLLAPWFCVLILLNLQGHLRSAWTMVVCFGLGLLAGSLGFIQAQFCFCIATAIVSIVAIPATRFRSLLFGAMTALGFVVMFPAWFPLLRNMDQFVTSRSYDQCISALDAVGGSSVWYHLNHFVIHTKNIGSLTGFALILITLKDWKQKLPALALFGCIPFVVFAGHWVCGIEGLNGVRYARHLSAATECFFLISVGVAIHHVAMSRRYVVALGTLIYCFYLTSQAHNPRFWIYFGAGVVFFALAYVRKIQLKPSWHYGLMVFALFLFTVPSVLVPNRRANDLLQGKWFKQLGSYPYKLPEDSTIGSIQKISQSEDRRHYSPTGILYPNWSAAFGILDLRVLFALYPKSYYALNSESGLTDKWARDAYHQIRPDRFVHTTEFEKAFSIDFQKVLILNRVSLLSYANWFGTFFSEVQGPYQREKCESLSQSKMREVYLCPEIGGVGYFPKKVVSVNSQEEALEYFRRSELNELVDIALVGPEGVRGLPSVNPASGRVIQVKRLGDLLSYQLKVTQAGLFSVADTWFRGWTATVNGQPVELVRTNVAFKGVWVPKGDVTVKWVFAPTI